MGEIVSVINSDSDECMYIFKVLSDEKGFCFPVVKEISIIDIKEKVKVPCEPWLTEHLPEISKAFEHDMSQELRGCIVYDTLDDIEEEFREIFYMDSPYLKRVAGKSMHAKNMHAKNMNVRRKSELGLRNTGKSNCDIQGNGSQIYSASDIIPLKMWKGVFPILTLILW